MTPLETIIEEERKEVIEVLYAIGFANMNEGVVNALLTTAMQRAYRVGFTEGTLAVRCQTVEEARISWLRSEIKRLEGMKRNLNPRGQEFQELHEQYNLAITHIITPWKEELAELEKTQ